MAEVLLLTIEQVGELLGQSRSQIYRLMDAGRLESVTIGRSRRILRTSVDSFVAGLSAAA